MTFKFTQKRDLAWLKENVTYDLDQKKEVKWRTPLEEEVKLYICKHAGAYYLLNERLNTVAYINSSNSFEIYGDYYYKFFPFNNDTVEDFIDTVWFLLNGIDNLNSLFRAKSGKVSETAVSIFMKRLEGGFNSVDNYILNRVFDFEYDDTLFTVTLIYKGSITNEFILELRRSIIQRLKDQKFNRSVNCKIYKSLFERIKNTFTKHIPFNKLMQDSYNDRKHSALIYDTISSHCNKNIIINIHVCKTINDYEIGML